MAIKEAQGVSGASRRDIRIVQLLALPGGTAMVLTAPAAMLSGNLLRACAHSPRWMFILSGAVFVALAASAMLSVVLTPFAVVKAAEARGSLGAGTIILVLLSLGPLVGILVVLSQSLGLVIQ